jgi:hypothetical protein
MDSFAAGEILGLADDGVGRDGGPVALALALGSAALGAAAPTRSQGITPFLRRVPRGVGLPAMSPRPGRRGWWGPKRATSTVPRAMQTWVVWAAQ